MGWGKNTAQTSSAAVGGGVGKNTAQTNSAVVGGGVGGKNTAQTSSAAVGGGWGGKNTGGWVGGQKHSTNKLRSMGGGGGGGGEGKKPAQKKKIYILQFDLLQISNIRNCHICNKLNVFVYSNAVYIYIFIVQMLQFILST